MNNLNIPTDFLGKWYFSKETLNSITSSEDFNLEDFCKNIAMQMLLSDESSLNEIEEVLLQMQEFASSIIMEILPDIITVGGHGLLDKIKLDSMISENDEVILEFSLVNEIEKLKIKKSPSIDFLYMWNDESENWLTLINKPVVLPDDFVFNA